MTPTTVAALAAGDLVFNDRIALHLRSSTRPQVETSRKGRVVVWTECGRLLDASMVDNESSSCPECQRVDARLAGAS